MTPIRLSHVPFSRSFRILWLLEELGLPCEIEPHDIRRASTHSGDYYAKSPAGRVPALEIDGQVLFESGAIVEYLCETRAEAGLGRAPAHPERAAYLQWIHFAETMASGIESLNLSHIFLRPPARPSPAVVKITTARLRLTLAGMEARLAQDWLLPGGFSGADVMMGFNLFAAPYFVPFDGFPRLTAYRARIEARPAFQAARARDGEQDFYDRAFYPVPEG